MVALQLGAVVEQVISGAPAADARPASRERRTAHAAQAARSFVLAPHVGRVKVGFRVLRLPRSWCSVSRKRLGGSCSRLWLKLLASCEHAPSCPLGALVSLSWQRS